MTRIDRNIDLTCVAAATVAAMLMLTGDFGADERFATAAALLCAMSALVVWSDMRRLIILDGPVFCILVVAIAFRLSGGASMAVAWPWQAAVVLADGIVCGGCLYVVREAFYRLRGFDGLGLGDVKLAAACGALLGMTAFAWALLAASVMGLGIFAVLHFRDADVRTLKLPFGAVLAPACIAVWMMSVGLLDVAGPAIGAASGVSLP